MNGKQQPWEFFWDYKGVITHLYDRDIYYVHLEDRNLYVHTRTRNYPIGRKIREEEEYLSVLPIIRPHYSYVIHLYHLEAFIGNNLILRNGVLIPVSKNRKKQVKARIREYFQEKKSAKNQ